VGNGALQVVFQPNAEHTIDELSKVIANSAEMIAEALLTAHARYVDERTVEIVIAIAPDPVPKEKRKALAGAAWRAGADRRRGSRRATVGHTGKSADQMMIRATDESSTLGDRALVSTMIAEIDNRRDAL
jgi:hypothetical protein